MKVRRAGKKYEKARFAILQEALEPADCGVVESVDIKVFRLSLIVMVLLDALDLSDEAFLEVVRSEYTLSEEKK